jgi:hypothetical protein
MKPVRLVDLRVLLESACGIALILALLMPFFTVSAQSIVPAPVKAVTSITDAIPQEPMADVFVLVAVLALVLSVVRILRPGSGLVLMVLALAPFVAAGVLVAALQMQWDSATSGWQAEAARFMGVQFSHSFGFWVFLGAGVIGGGLVLTEIVSRLVGRRASIDPALAPLFDTQPVARSSRAPGRAAAEADGAGRLVVVESGRTNSVTVSLKQIVVLGRDSACGIRLSDPRVSRRHVSIERIGGGWLVRDLATTNPTRLVEAGGGTSEIGQSARLASGQLLIGDVLVTLYP